MVDLPKTQPAPDRHQLGFAVEVVHEFEFLAKLGFKLVERSDTLACFETSRRLVRVFHGRGSYELGVEIGRWVEVNGARREQVFPLRDVVSLQSDPSEAICGGTTATTPEQVRKFLRQLSEWTKRFAFPLLTDGDELFDELGACNAARGVAQRDTQRAALLRARADEAWQRRDFDLVVAAYTEIDLELSTIELKPSERGRMQYALKASQA